MSRGGRLFQTQRAGWHLRDPACGQSIPSLIWPGPQAFLLEQGSRPAVKSWTRSTVLPILSFLVRWTWLHPSIVAPHYPAVWSFKKLAELITFCSLATQRQRAFTAAG